MMMMDTWLSPIMIICQTISNDNLPDYFHDNLPYYLPCSMWICDISLRKTIWVVLFNQNGSGCQRWTLGPKVRLWRLSGGTLGYFWRVHLEVVGFANCLATYSADLILKSCVSRHSPWIPTWGRNISQRWGLGPKVRLWGKYHFVTKNVSQIVSQASPQACHRKNPNPKPLTPARWLQSAMEVAVTHWVEDSPEKYMWRRLQVNEQQAQRQRKNTSESSFVWKTSRSADGGARQHQH